MLIKLKFFISAVALKQQLHHLDTTRANGHVQRRVTEVVLPTATPRPSRPFGRPLGRFGPGETQHGSVRADLAAAMAGPAGTSSRQPQHKTNEISSKELLELYPFNSMIL